MIKIGITGGIGSGKSVVSEIFHLHGFPLYNADREAKKLNDSSPYIRKQLTRHFGENLYVNGKLDRKKLASIIFHDDSKLAIANSIIHPELANDFRRWSLHREHYSLVILDAALLIEAGFHQLTDRVIMITAPEELRIARVMQRDHSTLDEVKVRMNAQLPEEEKIKYADYIVINDNNHSLIQQVSEIIKKASSDGSNPLHS